MSGGPDTIYGLAGNLAAKGKIPYAILSLMDTLRNHPGQVGGLLSRSRSNHSSSIFLDHDTYLRSACQHVQQSALFLQVPDVDAVIHTSDFPCMLKIQPGTGALAPPVFGYNSHEKFVDIPFPDYSYWGHEYRRLLGEPLLEPENSCLLFCRHRAI